MGRKALGCCTHLWRWTLFVVNLILFSVGLALVAVGIYLVVTQSDVAFITGSAYASGGVLLIVSGLVTLAVCVVGLLAAAALWIPVLGIYIGVMVVIVVLTLLAGVLGFVFRGDVQGVVSDRAVVAISLYRNETDDDFQSDTNSFVDFVQSNFDCCGYESPSDWVPTTFFQNSTHFPESCECTDTNSTACTGTAFSPQTIWSQGCNDSLVMFLENNLAAIGAIGVCIGLLEFGVIAIAVGLCICAVVKKRKADSRELKTNNFSL